MANFSPPQQNTRTSKNATLVGLGANASPPGDVFSAALDEFKKSVPDKDLAQFAKITYDDLCKEIVDIQKKQDSRRELMHLSRIQSCLEAMKQFGLVIEVFVNVSNEVAFIWGPMKFLLLTASNFADSFEALIKAYEQIGEHMPLLIQYRNLFDSNSQLHEALKLMYVDVLEFHHQALKFFSGNLWKRFFKSMWKNFETKFSGILERLARHKDYVESCAGLASFQQSQHNFQELRTESQSLYQKYHIDMVDIQASNLAGVRDIQANVSDINTQTLSQIQVLQTSLTANRLQLETHHDKFVSQSRELVARHEMYLDEMAKIDSKLNELLAEEQQKNMKSVGDWLAVGHQLQEDHATFNKIRKEHPSTTKWILQNEAVRNWIESDSPAAPNLWVNGIPGAGKTILTSAIIEECKTVSSSSTCFFYCHDDDPLSCSAVGIIKALVHQLLHQHPYLLPPSYTRRATSGEPVLRSVSLATRMLEDFCLTLPKVFIIVDGLDECKPMERKQALDALMGIVSQCDIIQTGKLRLLAVSQDYVDIRRAFLGSGTNSVAHKVVQITHNDNEHDICTYVKFWVGKIASKYELLNDVTDYLTNLTVANAKGMFLFAKLVMQNLYEQPTREMLLGAIRDSNFPTELKEAYERILDRIKSVSSNAEWTEATKLLGWMVCAKRRLTWKEMQVALSIDIENQAIEYDNKRLRKHIQEICGSLVSVHGDRVSFVHSTAKTFITHVMPDIHEPSIECDLSVLCLQYLTFPCFDKLESDDEKVLQQLALQGFFAFQDYAVATWFHHINAFVNSGQEFLNKASNLSARVESFMLALDDFMTRFGEEDWEESLVDDCRNSCDAFEDLSLYDNLVLLTSHIYTFQKKGFEAKHKISIRGLDEVLQRNRKILEELPAKLEKSKAAGDLAIYRKFYDAERLYKCNRITCRYFSEGFEDKRSRKHHVNVHDRPYHCEVQNCLGQEGFAKNSDLQKHMRAYHPELCDLAQTFNTATAKSGKADHACAICGKTFTRSFHRKNHEASHRGERPHSCPECGKAFTRANDCKRHQKIHERKSK